jgi:S-DNA-T family DNA segregation ATPase FtsK/SpoIIIE
VAFKVASAMDSRIVLDQKGAELLLGQGDMLFLTPHSSEVKRAQGTLVEDAETRKVVSFLKNVAAPSFERSLLSIRALSHDGDDGEAGAGDGLNPAERDPMFDEAVRIMIESGRGSVSLLQRRLAIGYTRASRLVDQMGQAGILGEHKGSVAREVMITLEDWEQMKRLEEEGQSGAGGGPSPNAFGDSQDEDAMGAMSDDADADAPDVQTFNRNERVA